jgi:hypothetical protein
MQHPNTGLTLPPFTAVSPPRSADRAPSCRSRDRPHWRSRAPPTRRCIIQFEISIVSLVRVPEGFGYHRRVPNVGNPTPPRWGHDRCIPLFRFPTLNGPSDHHSHSGPFLRFYQIRAFRLLGLIWPYTGDRRLDAIVAATSDAALNPTNSWLLNVMLPNIYSNKSKAISCKLSKELRFGAPRPFMPISQKYTRLIRIVNSAYQFKLTQYRLGDGIDDIGIASAAAEIAAHPLADLRVRQVSHSERPCNVGRRSARPARFRLFDHRDRRHDLPRRTEAALEAVVAIERATSAALMPSNASP